MFYNPNWVANTSYTMIINDRPIVVQWNSKIGDKYDDRPKYVIVHGFAEYKSDPVVYARNAKLTTTMKTSLPKLDFKSFGKGKYIVVSDDNIGKYYYSNIYYVGKRSHIFLHNHGKHRIIIGGHVILLKIGTPEQESSFQQFIRSILNSKVMMLK